MSEIRKALQVERRQRYLKGLIEEAVVNVLAEQQQQPAPAAPPPSPPMPEPPMDAPTPEEGLESPAEFTVDDMIERLNVIRGGRSFTDPEVYGQLVTFFKNLEDEKKAGLQSFLMELGKIVINANEQQNAPEPGKQPAQQPAAPPPPPPPPAAGPSGGGMGTPPAPPV